MSAPQPKYAHEKAERLEARLSSMQKSLIQRAADLQGRSLTDFVVSCSQDFAKKIIREHEIISLTAKESELFVDTLLNESKPNVALKKAAKRYRTFIEDNNK